MESSTAGLIGNGPFTSLKVQRLGCPPSAPVSWALGHVSINLFSVFCRRKRTERDGCQKGTLTVTSMKHRSELRAGFYERNYRPIHFISVGVRRPTIIVQELCESRGGRPGLSVLTSLLVSVDVKLY